MMRLTKLLSEFIQSEKTGGLILILCTMVSLLVANSSFGEAYHAFFQTKWMGLSVEHWINDALMAIFFLLIGLELEREIYIGELSKLKDAMLPLLAAVGGMLIPAGIYLSLNWGTPTQSGAGIPMATDIAFALGILSLLGKRVPVSLKIFLTALAVIDDLGAILMIAVFYTKSLSWMYLFMALGIWLFLFILNRFKVYILIPYLIGGALMWFCMLRSGVHATITGVILAFAIPFQRGEENSISYSLQHLLHKPVAFIILPIFALANTAISLESNFLDVVQENYSLGIILGLILGKPVGIMLFSYVGNRLGFCQLPSDLNWKKILGVSCLAGIGFTMSIFITLLAFNNAQIINNAKLMILFASVVAGTIGFGFLRLVLPQNAQDDTQDEFIEKSI